MTGNKRGGPRNGAGAKKKPDGKHARFGGGRLTAEQIAVFQRNADAEGLSKMEYLIQRCCFAEKTM